MSINVEEIAERAVIKKRKELLQENPTISEKVLTDAIYDEYEDTLALMGGYDNE